MENLNDYFSKNIKGKRILITGGTTGIGRAAAELLVSLGGRVLILGRDKKDFKTAIDGIKEQYPDGEIMGSPADVTKKGDIKKIFKMADSDLGGIDILINNAALPADGVTDDNEDGWKYIIETNILAYLAFTKEAVERMIPQKDGYIINIGSMSAETREETGTVYVATKAAIRGFTAALRKEVNNKGIQVSLIEPGAVTSDMQPGSKASHRKKIERMEMLEANDIAMSIAFCLAQPKRCDIVTMQVRPHLQEI
jgi:NADP-dependent 3-hydroxy acid dehydrogenase YdfG